MPLAFEPGEEAQVDWHEGRIEENGVHRKARFFCMRMCFSKASFVFRMFIWMSDCPVSISIAMRSPGRSATTSTNPSPLTGSDGALRLMKCAVALDRRQAGSATRETLIRRLSVSVQQTPW